MPRTKGPPLGSANSEFFLFTLSVNACLIQSISMVFFPFFFAGLGRDGAKVVTKSSLTREQFKALKAEVGAAAVPGGKKGP